MWMDLLIGLGVAAAASWLVLVIALLLVRPKGNAVCKAAGLTAGTDRRA